MLTVAAMAMGGGSWLRAQERVAATDADEQLYLERYRKLPGGQSGATGLNGYDPLEPLVGANRPSVLPLRALTRGGIAPAALQSARRFAQLHQSSALLIWRDGMLESEDYFQQPSSDLIVSRSLAKPLGAIAIGRALALGKIRSLDQPVADFIAEWRADPRRSRILVRHLLDMRSGLLKQGLAGKPDDVLNRAYLHPRHDEIIIRDYPITDEPGSVYEYNNATSELIAIVIERATGRRYSEFLGREILQPLGAESGQVWVNRPGGTAHSGCCILLTARTWLRLGILLLQDGRANGHRLLSHDFVTEMRRGTPQNPYYGLGVYIAGRFIERRGFVNPATTPNAPPGVLHSEPYLAADLFLFDGNNNQVVYIIPSQRLVIARLASRTPAKGTPEWDNAFLPNTVLRGLLARRGGQAQMAQPR